MNLTDDAMQVSLRITAWSGRLYDRQASNHVAVHHDAAASAGRYNKCLLPKAAFAALTATVSACRTAHYENTVPWDDQGSRLLTVANYEHYTELMNGFRERMVRERARFIEDYDVNVDQARLDLGKLFRIEDYPSKEALHDKFSIRYRITPVQDAEQFMAKLATDDVDRVKRDIEQQIEERLHDAVGDLYRRFGEAVERVSERLQEDDNGKPFVFRDSMISNIRDEPPSPAAGAAGRTGAIWKKVKSWFGYGLHLIADTHYKVPVAFEVTRASGSEARMLLEELFGKAPEMAERCDDFSADRGLDNAPPQKKRLWDKWNNRPLIDTRLLWQAEKEEPGYDPGRPITRALLPDRADVVVHDERGRVSCICPKTGEERALAFQGFEADRGACGTLKYRCLRLRMPRRVPPCGRGGARRVRTHRAHRSRQPRPAHLHPVVAARLQAGFGDGADQQPPRAELQLRDPLHPRPEAGGDDGTGPGAGASRPRRADAIAGRRRSAARHRLTLHPPERNPPMGTRPSLTARILSREAALF